MIYLRYGFAALAFALALHALPAMASDRDDVLAAESAINAAIVRHDVVATQNLLTPDYTLIMGAQSMYDTASFLKLVGERSIVYSMNQAHDQSVRLYGDSTAVVIGILDVRGTVGSHAFVYHLRYTDTWVKIGDAWRQAAGHSTNLPVGDARF